MVMRKHDENCKHASLPSYKLELHNPNWTLNERSKRLENITHNDKTSDVPPKFLHRIFFYIQVQDVIQALYNLNTAIISQPKNYENTYFRSN